MTIRGLLAIVSLIWIAVCCRATSAAETPDEQANAQSQVRSGTPVVYRLSQEDFAELAAREDVIRQLETLKGVAFLNERALELTVRNRLAGLTKLADRFASTALETAQQIDSVRLTRPAFDRLLLANVPEAALELLQVLQDLPFADNKALCREVLTRLRPEGGEEAQARASNQKTIKAQDKCEVPKDTSDYRNYALQIVAQADPFRVYELTAESLEVLRKQPEFQLIPALMLDRLGKLQGVEIIDQAQFTQAVLGNLEIVYRHYRRMVLEAAGDSAQISAQVLETLKRNGLPDDILAILSSLQDKSYADRQALDMDLQHCLQAPVTDFIAQGYLQLLLQQARRVIPEALGELPIPWDGGSCGCSRKFSKVVYGFYPFWLVDEMEKPERAADAKAVQTVDFSTLTRIGYYGLHLDEKGEIGSSRQWDHAGDLSFVQQASKYRTYLDLVVYTNAWDSWSDAQISRAAKAVADKLNLPLKPAFTDRLQALLPFMEESPATMGDGVTIYFQGVTDADPSRVNARKHIVSFIQKLHQELQLLAKPPILNIMFKAGEPAADGQSSFLKLLAEQPELLGIGNSSKDLIDSILVLLDEPTADSKKRLRAKIESTFKGKDRRTVLRKILPVISSVGQDKDPNGAYTQFTDDLIYFEDNFHGVGLWPLPLTTQGAVPEINRLILEHLKPDEQQDFVQGVVLQYFPRVCDYACPNRWRFRMLFDILVIALLSLGAVSLGNRRLRQRLKANTWPVLGLVIVLILVYLLSLVCDPYWGDRSNEVAFGLVIVLVFAGGGLYLKLNRGRPP